MFLLLAGRVVVVSNFLCSREHKSGRNGSHVFDVLNADGVILETNSAGAYPGDEALLPILRELDARSA